MDRIYIGEEIPQDFHYAVFNNGYIDLYNTNTFSPNRDYTFYRIYTNTGDKFYYDMRNWRTTSTSYTRDTTTVVVSPFWYDRPDFDKVFVCIFILCFGVIWLLNLFTSIVRKGGLLGGLS